MQDRYLRRVTPCVIVAEGRDVDIQRAYANVLNKQSGTADKGWFSWMGIRRIAYNSLLWHMSMLQNATHGLGLEGVCHEGYVSPGSVECETFREEQIDG
jgi:hypothetical protein